MDKSTVDKIFKHAKIARDAYADMPESFRKYFHLRPTSDNITIVSTLPYAPMRGLSVSPDDLSERLSAIQKKLPSLLSMSDTSGDLLRELGFQARRGKRALEEDIQASFIRGMLDNESEYQGIAFVASELTLGDNKRFDVVGFKDDTLYIFELKRARTVTAAPQVKAYCELVMEHRDSFERVLFVYPNRIVPHFNRVKGIAVMSYAENSDLKTWKDWCKAASSLTPSQKCSPDISGIDIWLFQQALAFKKLPNS
ncbi:MAG: hypothetical protein J5449_01775 [Oscillospiraceae bacterium]|nr:hypothetical protein [Oscillospiraceae bacterium]